jgi:hypothetical protein
MSNKCSLCIILFFISIQLQAQTQFLPVFKNGKWGVIDAQANIIISPKYTYIGNFDAQNQAVALIDGKVGIIDNQDNIIIPFKYNNIQKITPNLYAVLDEKWGVINIEGEIALPFKYDLITLNKLLYRNYSQFSDTSDFFILTQQNDKKGILTSDFKVLSEPFFEDIYRISESLWIGTHESKHSLLNLEGKLQTFDSLSFEYWQDDFVLVSQKDDLIGLMDAQGKELIPIKFDEIEKLTLNKQPYWFVSKGTERGLYSLSGRAILAPIYQKITEIGDDLLAISTLEGQGIANNEGEILLPCAYSKLRLNQNRYVFFTQKNLMGLYDINLQRNIFEPVYINIEMLQISGSIPIYRVTGIDDKKTILNKDKKVILNEENADEIYYDPAGTFKIRKGKLWGISGELGIILPQFDNISRFTRNIALVEKNGKKGLINILGQVIADPIYEKIELKGQTARIQQANQNAVEYIELDAYGRVEDRFQVNNLRKITVNKNQNSSDEEDALEEFDFELDDNLRFPENANININRISDTTAIQDNGFTFYWGQREWAWGIKDSKDSILYVPQFSSIMFDTLANLYFLTKRSNINRSTKDYIFNAQIGKMILENAKINVSTTISDFQRSDFTALRGYYLMKDGTRLNQLEYTTPTEQVRTARIFFAESFTPNGYSRVNILGEYSQYFSENTSSNIKAEYIKYGKWGLLGKNKLLVAPNYEFISLFDVKGFALVKANGKWGILDTLGKELIKPAYDELSYFPDQEIDYWLLQNNKSKAGFVDSTQRVSIALIYKDVRGFCNQRAAVQLENGTWNFIDTQGNLINKEEYIAVSEFQEGFAAVKQGRYWYYIDAQGKTLVKEDFTQAYNFSDGLAVIIKRGKYGYINTQGEEAIPCIYREAQAFKSGVAVVKDESNKLLLLDAKGMLIQKVSYEKINPFNELGLASYRPHQQKNNYGLLNKEGKALTQANYQSIEPFREGFALAKKRDRFLFIDTLGNELKGNFLVANGFSEGLAVVKTDEGWGYIDTSGAFSIPPSFDYAYSFYKGWAKVIDKKNNVVWIDTKGNKHSELPKKILWKDIDFTPRPTRGLPKKLQVARDGKIWQDENHSFFSIQGTENQEFKFYNSQSISSTNQLFSYIGDINEGFIDVKVQHSYGLASLEGEILLPAEYDNLSYIGDNLFRVEHGGKIGYFQAQKKQWIWQLQK